MSSLVHIDDKKKDIVSLSYGPTYGLDDTALSAEKEQRNLLSNRRNFV